jgi:hypothetical protein
MNDDKTATYSAVIISLFLLSYPSYAAPETIWALNLQPCECQLVKGGLDDNFSTAPLVDYLSCIGGLDKSTILTALSESGSTVSGRAGGGNAETTVPLLDGSKKDIGRVGLVLIQYWKGFAARQGAYSTHARGRTLQCRCTPSRCVCPEGKHGSHADNEVWTI